MMRPMDEVDQQYFSQFRSKNVLRTMNMPNRNGPRNQNEQQRIPIVSEQDDPSHYQHVIDTAGYKWPSEDRILRVIDTIRRLPPGYRTTMDLSGIPLGYLCMRLTRSDRHPYVLNGLYLTGVLRDFYTFLVESDSDFGGNKTVYRSVDQLHIKEFPLWKVEAMSPQDMGIFYSSTSFESYLEECIASKGGSDMNCYFLWENCSIARRNRMPQYIERNVFVTRTAGLSHIITKSYEKEFDFHDIRYTLFIPDGLQNCFTDAVRYGYLKRYAQLFSFPPSNQEEFMDPATGVLQTPYTVKEEYIDQLLMDIELERLGGGNAHQRERNRRKRILQHGFSTHEMNQRAALLIQKASIVPLVYRINGKPDFPYLKNYCNASVKLAPDTFLADSLLDFVSVLLMTDSGHILDPMKHKQYLSAPSASGLLHAISIYPTIMENTFTTYEDQIRFVQEVEKITVQFMKDMYTESTYCVGGESYDAAQVNESIQRIIDVQRDRHNHRLTDTLIFHSKKEKRKGNLRRQLKQYHERPPPTDIPLVIAYDIETVAYDITDEDTMKSKVWGPFQKNTSLMNDGEFLPLDCQIPFSVQWVPVNLSEGESAYAKKKIENWITPRSERADSTTLLNHPELLDLLSDGVTRPVDIILQPPRTCYGEDQLLGQCVHHFLREVGEYAIRHKYNQVFCYAHNGVSFDSYIILNYCLHPISKILKTSRGILSMTIEVPIEKDEILHTVLVTFRDTRVHIAGSLKAICKSFKVPSEWVKLDFPITMVNSTNCFHPEVIKISKPYGENDVLCLAYIVKRLNESLMNSEWEPADICNDRPPIVQFLTCMSMVKASTLNHFRKTVDGGDHGISCHAIDLPSLRHWIQEATMGGRANAYARSYASPHWPSIYQAFMRDDIDGLKRLYQVIRDEHTCKQVLDVTSLYPFAQSHSPLPLGDLFYMNRSDCESLIASVHCDDCIQAKTLCSFHRVTTRTDTPPFAIVLVHKISRNNSDTTTASFRNMCGRKLHHTGGLIYSQETPEEIMHRLGEKEQRNIQSYTHIDLYWMRKQGFTFEVICGLAWATSFTYASFIIPAFHKRIDAKKEGNKVLSEMLKLMYNSAYGVTTQRDIDESYFLTKLPPHLKDRCTSDPELVNYLLDKCDKQIGPDEEMDESITFPSGQTYIKKRKKQHINEFYGEQSPMHIGASILANARHIMNLLLFSEPSTLMTYTDTDSICIADHVASQLGPDLLNDREDAFMGTYKNDHNEGPHGENNHGARVVMSLIGTKKVKMHVTLNPNGEIKIFNTFKGLNPANHLPGEKDHMHSDYVDKIVTDSLIHIGLLGHAPDVQVTHWKRDLSHGVSISDHPQASKSDTYLGHSIGTRFAATPAGIVETFIPFGYPSHEMQPTDCIPLYNPTVDQYEDDPKRLSLLCASWGFSDPQHILEDTLAFSKKYYKKHNEKNTLDDPEFIYYMNVFNSINQNTSLYASDAMFTVITNEVVASPPDPVTFLKPIKNTSPGEHTSVFGAPSPRKLEPPAGPLNK